MTIGEALDAAARSIRLVLPETPRLDATLLLAEATGLGRATILAHPETRLSPLEAAAFEALVARRVQGEPVAYILGRREFYGRSFTVDPRVLIPRPETEPLVEHAIRAVRRLRGPADVQPFVVVDVGTGTGAIAITVALEAASPVLAVDVSTEALLLADENRRALGAEALVELRQSDLLDRVEGPIHVLLANLPYIPDDRVLTREVAAYEPALALRGGPDGSRLIRRLLDQAVSKLAPTAEVLLEIDDAAQGQPLAAFARTLFPAATVAVLRDAAGLERVLRLRTSAA
ncbi:MAG: peptide chain release factor N(5)-glutamine methyltransferase [Chloroflexi bacterium]|nr:peptide chain release factor N(5)-glutamine methyltransferase [Chloroflexota bacterium]